MSKLLRSNNRKPNYIVLSDECQEETAAKDQKEYSSPIGSNQIYFYDDVTRTSIYALNRNLDITAKNLQLIGINYNLSTIPPIELYISSEGGEVFSAFSAVDRIKSSKVPVHSYVEGIAASAATLLSVIAHRRFIRSNSFMLIHQVRGGLWGNFVEFKDEMQNLELIMHYIKGLYLKHTKFTEEELDNLLTHDIYLNAEQCLEKGLVDEIV